MESAMRFGARRALLLLMALMIPCMPCNAYLGEPTDHAFAALLSMPGAAPENGAWHFPIPDDLHVRTEAQLIGYLARKQKAGANFNAYRHHGTLLHHAIRARLTKTALWLLEHGADPHLTVLSSSDNTLVLARHYGQVEVAQILEKRYGLRPAAPLATPVSTAMPPPQPQSSIDDAPSLLQQAAWLAVVGQPASHLGPWRKEPIKEWQDFANRIPSDVYARIMDHDQAITDLVRLHSRSGEELSKALARLPASLLQRHAKAAVGGLAQVAQVNFRKSDKGHVRHAVPPEAWRALWKQLDAPIDYAEWPGLVAQLQPELWDELYASGYANHDAKSALGCMLTEIGADEFESLWPYLARWFANIRQVAPHMVLGHYRMVVKEQCWNWDEKATAEKLAFLTVQGIHGPVAGIVSHSLPSAGTELFAAMQPFLTPGPDLETIPKLMEVKARCHFTLTDLWYQALLDEPTMGEDYENVSVEQIQLIEIPGESRCSLLVGGYSSINDNGSTDTFIGPEIFPRASCPDPTDRYEIWHENEGRIEHLTIDMGGDYNNLPLIPIEDRRTGQRFYLNDGGEGGMCRPRAHLPFALQWQQQPSGWSLVRTSQSAALEDALFEQCSIGEGGLRCRDIPSLAPGDTDHSEPTPAEAYGGLYRENFIKAFRAAEYQSYIAAILAVDKPALRALESHGIPGSWIAEAIQKVSSSDLSLTTKRKAIAWIFHDHDQLARALDRWGLDTLLDWLPREDWTPVIKTMLKHSNSFGANREKAQEKGLTDLACAIDHAENLLCRGSWEVAE